MKTALHVPVEISTYVRRCECPLRAANVALATNISNKSADEYLRRMVKRGKLARRGPGVFTVPRHGRPSLEPTPMLELVSAAISRDLPMTPVVGWTTEWLAPYAHNVPTRHWTILEAAPFALTALADVLARAGLRAVINPPKESVADLLRLFEQPLILWRHSDTYAISHRHWLKLPEPERLLVDLYFAVTRRGLPYPENDLAVVIARFVTECDLNIASILSYAKRRKIGSEITSYLRSIASFPPDVKEAINLIAGTTQPGHGNN